MHKFAQSYSSLRNINKVEINKVCYFNLCFKVSEKLLCFLFVCCSVIHLESIFVKIYTVNLNWILLFFFGVTLPNFKILCTVYSAK